MEPEKLGLELVSLEFHPIELVDVGVDGSFDTECWETSLCWREYRLTEAMLLRQPRKVGRFLRYTFLR